MEHFFKYADNIIAFLVNMFTPQQQTALTLITIIVIVSTNQFKVIWFAFFPVKVKGNTDQAKKNADLLRNAIIHLFALIMGMVCGMAGHFFEQAPRQPMWFWIVAGILSGGLSIGIYKSFRRFLGKEKVISNE